MSSLYPNRLPENMSGMKITDAAHFLNSVSPTALLRADGWEAGAKQIDTTCAGVEKVLDPRMFSVSAGTPVAANDNRAPAPVALAA